MRVLIVDDMHPVLMEQLTEKGISFSYQPQITPEQISKSIGDYHGLVVRSKVFVDKHLLEKATQLFFIARAGSGMDNIDVAAANLKGVELINVPEANADAVGEHTVGMLLGLMNHLARADREVRNKIWLREANRGHELKGKTLAIIGYGHTGMAVAKKLSGFEVNIIAYDKYRTNYGDQYASEATMEEVFNQADILSLHIPLTDETFHMVNADYIDKFNKKVFLLNLSRGKIVHTVHLVQALQSGLIQGCALDVLENENLNSLSYEEEKTFNALLQHERVMLSPHIGGWTQESYKKISFFLSNKISYLANRFAKADYKGQSKT